MNFVIGLFWTLIGKDIILVIIDWLTKSAYFLPVTIMDSLSKHTWLYIRNIFRMYGVPKTIVLDWISRFTFYFRKSLQKLMGIQLKFNSAYHPQTNEQSEKTIYTLEDMTRACVFDFKGTSHPTDWVCP